jgi:hypothetical protein
MIGRRRDGERPYGPPSASGGPTSPSADSPRLPRLSCGEAGDDLKGHLRAMRGVPSSLAPLRVWRLRLVHAPCDERCGGEDERRVEEEGVAPGRRLGLGDGCRFRRHPHFVLVSTTTSAAATPSTNLPACLEDGAEGSGVPGEKRDVKRGNP